MKLRVEFGQADYKEVTWSGKLLDFPRLIKFHSWNYEWVVYDEDKTKKYDYILVFSKLNPHDTDYDTPVHTWDHLFGNGMEVCECGARFTSFPQVHMRMCKLWRPWQ